MMTSSTPVHWRQQQIGIGVTRCPIDADGQPLRANMGYVAPPIKRAAKRAADILRESYEANS